MGRQSPLTSGFRFAYRITLLFSFLIPHSNFLFHRKMENAAFTSQEIIEMEKPKTEMHKNPQSPLKLENGNGTRYYCDVSKCCNTNQTKNEGSWHSTKTKFLVSFLIGFFVWAICYFCLLRNKLI